MRSIWFSFIFSFSSLHAGIISTSDFDCIEKECAQLGKNSLILFDVDATLILPDDVLLKPQGKELFKHLIEGYTDRDLFREIRLKASHSLVDSRSIGFIHKLQEREVPVIAFTAAPAKIKGSVEPGIWRVNELKGYGFDFSFSFPCDSLELPKNPNQRHFPFFKRGVLYSSLHSKGDILIAFLEKLDLKPDKIIFIDDELEYVQSVVSCLKKEGIDCLGIHYTAANILQQIYCSK